MNEVLIYVSTFKYGGRPHYRFPVRLLSRTPAEIIVYGEYGRPLNHYTRGIDLPIANQSVEFYFPGEPFTVAADFDREGVLRKYYCNVILPLAQAAGEITWVDLDLDLIVQPDLTWEVVDEDEFTANAVALGYPDEVRAGARAALAALIRRVESRTNPFDGTASRLLERIRTER